MRFWVGVTDYDWFRFLAARPELPEVNFWQPSARRRPVTLDEGALFLFKLHASQGGSIVGGGFFVKYSALPVRLTWDTFGIENGAASFEEMVTRIGRYRRTKIDVHADQVGCLVLVEPFYLEALGVDRAAGRLGVEHRAGQAVRLRGRGGARTLQRVARHH